MLAVVGNLSLDRVARSRPRIGGGAYHAARALRAVDAQAVVVARCGDGERSTLHPRLVQLGVPTHLLHATTTTAFSFSYDGDRRLMHVDAVGDAWTADDAATLDSRVRWVHLAPLLRSDFDAETVAAFARGRRVLLDGQGLVRVRRVGPLELDGDFDPNLLKHVEILKLSEEEAEAAGDVDVPEVLLTRGARGATVVAGGRRIDVRARPLARDPTGAGDIFASAYLASRARGFPPVSAARRATSVVAALL